MEIQAEETSWKGPLSCKAAIHQLHFALSWYRISVAAKLWCRKPGSASASQNAPYILVTCHVKYYNSRLNCGPQGQSLLTSSFFFFFYSALVTHVPIATALPWWKSQHFQGLLSPYVTSVAVVVIGRSPARRWLALFAQLRRRCELKSVSGNPPSVLLWR